MTSPPVADALTFLPGALCFGPLVGVAIMIAVGAWGAAHAERKSLAALAGLACPRCGVLFATDGAAAARKEDRARRQRRLADALERGFRLRLALHWTFACHACGTELVFEPDRRSLALTPA